MITFTGWQYMLIDLANHFGLDKELFEVRIKWAEDNLDNLEALADQADTYPLYMKAVMAIRMAQAGKPTGHLVGLDACCSGIQIMSALTGCVAGATATGLVNPHVRADAYQAVTSGMNTILGNGFSIKRSKAKEAVMKAMYGSTRVPKQIFGEDTPELLAFYGAMIKVAPGAWALLKGLLNSWQDFVLEHKWQLPDGFNAIVKVIVETDPPLRIAVDELGGASFSYITYTNEGIAKGGKGSKSIAANVVHSVDAYVVRSIQRRCNYDADIVEVCKDVIDSEIFRRIGGYTPLPFSPYVTSKTKYYCELYEKNRIADVVLAPYLNYDTVKHLSDEHLKGLDVIIKGMLEYKPFPVITIHDEFKCHPNNMNHLRQQYINILADIADSTVINSILSSIYGCEGTSQTFSKNLGKLIRLSNYGLS